MRGIDWPEGYSGRVIGNDFSASWVGKEQAFAASAGQLRLYYH
ncbi:2-nitropropane dioxygenase, NPD, partial [Pseudomonas syringae pv. pisi str. 1704B]